MYENKKRIFLLLLILTLLFSLFTVYIYSEGGLSLSAKSSVLYEPSTNTFLYSKNSNKKMPMASTTKIMTAIIAIERGNLESVVIPNEKSIGVEGSSIYMKPEESFNFLDLIYALMLQSANDVATALAYEISGGVSEFAELMNDTATELGLENTHFMNPHGLDEKYHYTTAHDLAVLSAYALKNHIFKEIVSCKKRVIESSLSSRTLVNHNKLLNMYDGAIGVKTGFTKKSGRSLVGACEKDGITLISVTINAPDDWNDHKKLFDYGYSTLSFVKIAKIGQFHYRVPIISSEEQFIDVKNEEELSLPLICGENNIKTQIILPRYLIAPVKKGDIVGKIIFTKDGLEIGKVNLIAQNNIDKKREHFSIF